MKDLLLLAILLFSLAIADDHLSSPIFHKRTYDDASLKQLVELRETIQEWAHWSEGVACRKACNPAGCDTCLWTGLLCGSGDKKACEGMNNLQDSNGQIWRSPWQVGEDPTKHSVFSRDMTLGVLVSLFETKNQTMWESWLDFSERSNGTCPHQLSCKLVLEFWCTFDHVGHFHGWSRPSERIMFPMWQKEICPHQNDLFFVNSIVDRPDYPLHLLSIHMQIRQMMDIWTTTLQDVADKIYSRNPLNCHYLWLQQGPTQDVADCVLAHAPRVAPKRGGWSFQWVDEDKPWLDSMGHEFVALINQLTNWEGHNPFTAQR